MRDQHKLVLFIEQFAHRKHPRLQLRQANEVVWLVNEHRSRRAGLDCARTIYKAINIRSPSESWPEKSKIGSATRMFKSQLKCFGIQSDVLKLE